MNGLKFLLLLFFFRTIQTGFAQLNYPPMHQKDSTVVEALYFADYGLTAYFETDDIHIVTQNKFNLNQSYTASDSWSISRNRDSELRLIIDDTLWNWSDSEGWVPDEKKFPKNSIRIHTPKMLPESGLGFKRLDDELVIITEFKQDSIDPFAAPLKSVIYPDEDSILVEQSTGFFVVVYPSPKLGYERSGIYNYQNGEWFVPPVYKKCEVTKKGYFLTKIKRYPDVDSDWEYYYTLIDFDGEVVFEDYHTTNFAKHPDLFKLIIANNDQASLTELTRPFEAHFSVQDEFTNYRLKEEGKYQIYQGNFKEHMLANRLITQSADFIHYNQDFGFIYWVSNDSIYLDWENQVYAVGIKTGSIEVIFNHALQTMVKRNYYPQPIIVHAEINVYQNDDSLSYCFNIKRDFQFKCTTCRASLKMHEGKLVIQDKCALKVMRTDYGDISYEDNREYFKEFYESENSSIWSLDSGMWTKVSTDYAEITPVPFGYLVRTPKIYKEASDSQEGIDQSARYLLLDTNLRAMSFMDFFDFEGAEVYPFGVSLCDENGCFLVNNQGKAVTTTEWDTFLLEKGKVKAIRFDKETRQVEKEAYVNLNLR
jgi:hypothetical protein